MNREPQGPTGQKQKILEVEEKAKRVREVVEERMAENFTNMMSEVNQLIHELNPNKINWKKSLWKYIIIKLLKNKGKEKNFESNQRETEHYL